MTISQTKMSTQETANFFGITKDTLRFYEQKGIIPHVPRDQNGYRVYTDYELNRIYLVLNLKSVGLSLKTIAKFVELFQNPTTESLQEQKDILQNQILEIDKNLHNLETVKKQLQHKLDIFDDQFAKYKKENMNDLTIKPIWKNYKKLN